jgi:hypothetical protein
MRTFAETTYSISPEQVIGSTGKLAFEMRAGSPVLVKLLDIEFVNDSTGKPVAIQKHIGRRQSHRSAIPTATWKCCNGQLLARAHAWPCSFSTPT